MLLLILVTLLISSCDATLFPKGASVGENVSFAEDDSGGSDAAGDGQSFVNVRPFAGLFRIRLKDDPKTFSISADTESLGFTSGTAGYSWFVNGSLYASPMEGELFFKPELPGTYQIDVLFSGLGKDAPCLGLGHIQVRR